MITFKEFIENKLLESSDEILKAQDATRQRVIDHIDRVKYFYNKLVEGGIVPEEDINTDQVEEHDSDKLKQENIRRQALRMTANGVLSPKDEKDVYEVIRDHVKTSPHHCEFWGLPNEDHMSVGVNCEKMPDKYIYEMMADWAATAEERGSKIVDWFNKAIVNDKRWIFNSRQIDTIKKCIDFLEPLVDKNKKRNYGFKYVDPATIKK